MAESRLENLRSYYLRRFRTREVVTLTGGKLSASRGLGAVVLPREDGQETASPRQEIDQPEPVRSRERRRRDRGITASESRAERQRIRPGRPPSRGRARETPPGSEDHRQREPGRAPAHRTRQTAQPRPGERDAAGIGGSPPARAGPSASASDPAGRPAEAGRERRRRDRDHRQRGSRAKRERIGPGEWGHPRPRFALAPEPTNCPLEATNAQHTVFLAFFGPSVGPCH